MSAKSQDKIRAVEMAGEVIQLWADITMMYQQEFGPLFKRYHELRLKTKQPRSDALLLSIVQTNFERYFPEIPMLDGKTLEPN
jgi:hypothetical protein